MRLRSEFEADQRMAQARAAARIAAENAVAEQRDQRRQQEQQEAAEATENVQNEGTVRTMGTIAPVAPEDHTLPESEASSSPNPTPSID